MPALGNHVPSFVECVTIRADADAPAGALGLAEALTTCGFQVILQEFPS